MTRPAMKGWFAFYRLLGRPLWWLVVAQMTFMIGGIAWLHMDDSGGVLGPWGPHMATPDGLRALWRDTLLVPALFGCIALTVSASLLAHPFATLLPSVRTRLLRGATSLGIFVSLAVALFHARVEGTAIAVTAFAVALVAYGQPVAALLIGIPTIIPRALLLASIVLVLDPSLIITLATSFPIAFALGGMFVSAAIIARGWRAVPHGHDASPAAASSGGPLELGVAKLYGFGRRMDASPGADRAWRPSLAADRTIDWFRSAAYEAAGGLRFGWIARMFVFTFANALIIAGALSMSGYEQNMSFLLLMTLGTVPLPFSSGLSYPISRARRATIEHRSTLAWSVACSLLMGAEIPIAYRLFAPLRLAFHFHSSMRNPTIAATWISIATAFALAPAVQWRGLLFTDLLSRVNASGGAESTRGGVAGMALLVGASVTGTVFVQWASSRSNVAQGVLAIGVLALVIHTTYWIILRRKVCRSDLV